MIDAEQRETTQHFCRPCDTFTFINNSGIVFIGRNMLCKKTAVKLQADVRRLTASTAYTCDVIRAQHTPVTSLGLISSHYTCDFIGMGIADAAGESRMILLTAQSAALPV